MKLAAILFIVVLAITSDYSFSLWFAILLSLAYYTLRPQRGYRTSSQIRAYRIRRNGGSHTQSDWIKLCIRANYHCLCCKQRKVLTKDHIKPLALGGSNSIKNIQPLCIECNQRKGAKHIDFRPWYWRFK